LNKKLSIAIATVCDSWYYIHFDQNISTTNGNWKTPFVAVGSEHDHGKTCSILALVATKEARRRMLDYLRNPLRGPLCSLPEGVTVTHQIPIHRALDLSHTVEPIPNQALQCQLAPPEEVGLPIATMIALLATCASSVSAVIAFMTYLKVRRKPELRIHLPRGEQ
jgi:hypothetical protein